MHREAERAGAWRSELRDWLIWSLLAKGLALAALWWLFFRGSAG